MKFVILGFISSRRCQLTRDYEAVLAVLVLPLNIFKLHHSTTQIL